jgi:ADYC domain
VVLHHFVVRDRDGGQVDLCDPDADGRSLGFPIPNDRGGFDLTCTSGAVGKCVRWGYRPWEERPGGPPLKALHQACVHMARADYGGDGYGSTRDGTLIFFCDRFGIHACGQGALMGFEAGWGRDGATCVARPRIPGHTLEQLAERYPQLKPRLGAGCTEDGARSDPATLLFNRSQE